MLTYEAAILPKEVLSGRLLATMLKSISSELLPLQEDWISYP